MFANIITSLVAVEAIIIMAVEMFGSTAQQAKAFDLKKNVVQIPEVKVLLANQGVYNGLFGLLILITMLLLSGPQQTLMLQLEMLFIIIVAVYGSLTASRKIIVIQGLPAIIALIALYLK